MQSFIEYAWVVPLKDSRRITIVNAFQKIISKGRKPNKIWVDRGGRFYNNLFKVFLKINNIEMYLKNKIFKHMSAVSNNFYFDVLDDIVNKYNNTVDRTKKMKPIDVISDFYAEHNEDSN